MKDNSKQAASADFKFLPLSIRLETLGGIATPLVLRGTPLPTKRVETFATASDGQISVEVNILIGESSLAERCRPLGKFQLAGIPPQPRGKAEIRLVFSVGRDCSVHVRASLEGSAIEAEEAFEPPEDLLTSESITKIRTEAEQSEQEDEQLVSLIEARTAAELAIKQAEEKLQAFVEKKTGIADPESVKRAIAQIGQALESEDAGRVREATQALNSRLRQGSDFDTIFGASAFSNLFTQQPSRAIPKKPAPSRARSKSSAKARPLPQHPGTDVATASNIGSSLGKIFGGGDFTLDPNLCFVLMPFEETFQPIYDDHIRPTIQSGGLSCLRADDIRGTTLITRDTWEKINRARVIVADLSGQNPNVFYEVGLAHAIGKDVLLLTQTMTDVPFDLKALRCIVYTYTPRGVKELESALKATVAALMKSG